MLSHHCFRSHAQFRAFSSQFCTDMLHDLPSVRSVSQLATLVGVDSQLAQEVLELEELDLLGAQ